MIDVYDHEVIEINKVMDALKARSTGARHLDDFDREIKERFADIGFRVTVNWHTAAGPDNIEIPDLYMPEVTIDGRIAPDGDVLKPGEYAFDHDQQVHEVTNDLLELGEEGVIKTGKIDPGQQAILDAHKHHRH